MSTYTPDKYTILEIIHEDGNYYKVFGSWAGGYLGSDNWRMNSGIERAVVKDGTISFIGYSGSEYKCVKASEGVIGSYNIAVLDNLLRDYEGKVLRRTLQECIANNYFEVEGI